jgi:drug/metabolite transporter (DMT)-like permease
MMNKNLLGWINGFVGMLFFSGSMPATRVAVLELDPLFVTVARASIAGFLALAILVAGRERLPTLRQAVSLAAVALGVVLGFPLFSALALQTMTSAESMVFLGLLPLATSLSAVLRAGERPRAAFWAFALLGAVMVTGFAFSEASTVPLRGALYMIAAIVVCGLGYAEGAVLSRSLGGMAVICWALVISLPVMLLVLPFVWPEAPGAVHAAAWWGLAYIAVFSMLVGFIFWYRGLALAGISAVGQLQLLQPFFGLLLAVALLREPFQWSMVVIMIAAAVCVMGARRTA